MAKAIVHEKWKTVDLGRANGTGLVLEVSNLGRVRTTNKIFKAKIIKGSMIKGYPIIKLKLFTKRSKEMQAKIDDLQQKVFKQAAKIRGMQEAKAAKTSIKEQQLKLLALKEKLTSQSESDIFSRTINYHCLVHRLVAMHHVPKPKANQTVVAHIDFNKNNNAASNLKWMSVDENRIHQQKSPHVIKEQKNRRGVRNAATTKLTEKQVIKIKALLKEGKLSNRAIAAKFNVSDMQIGRIVRGENWASVK